VVVGDEEELGPVGQWVVGAEAAGTQRAAGVGRLARARPRVRVPALVVGAPAPVPWHEARVRGESGS
jgi:hypothetical protein